MLAFIPSRNKGNTEIPRSSDPGFACKHSPFGEKGWYHALIREFREVIRDDNA
jgi:hypothetical protein